MSAGTTGYGTRLASTTGSPFVALALKSGTSTPMEPYDAISLRRQWDGTQCIQSKDSTYVEVRFLAY